MEILNDSEKNAKISDSGYSNSCSNSQSRRSHSTHSGSNSSRSSGYGGKPSTSGYSNNNQSQPKEKRSKDKKSKKKTPPKSIQTDVNTTEKENKIECIPEGYESFKEEILLTGTPTPALAPTEKVPELKELSEKTSEHDEISAPITFVSSGPNSTQTANGFSCVISMQDGVVMYTTASITTALGYPKEMWIGRSFIDFVHPRDRTTFASQITNGIVTPKNSNRLQEKAAPEFGEIVSTMICRIRRYKGLSSGFGIKDRVVTFIPYLLKFFFKIIIEEEKEVIYLVIEGLPLMSAFKLPNEVIVDPKPFIMRHTPSGKIEYVDPESVPYLGYLPQDIVEKDILQLYYPSDLIYLRQVYETIIKEGGLQRSKPYRFMAQNGDFLKLETEWSSFINPWSKKLEYVIAKHFIIEGPNNPDVFDTPEVQKSPKETSEEEVKAQALREKMVRIMNEVLTKPAEAAKQKMNKRCQDLASFMETLLEEIPKVDEELHLEIHDTDNSRYERETVMLGGISPHHDFYENNLNSEAPLNFTQLNYNENIQRFFDTHESYTEEDKIALANLEKASISEMEKQERETEFSSGEFEEMGSTSDSSAPAATSASRAYHSNGIQSLRLTESLINKHNIEMEKELFKLHRETRVTKIEREKAAKENRRKKKEHLARCNAAYQPTTAGLTTEYQSQGLKRSSRHTEGGTTHKQRCASPKVRRKSTPKKLSNSPLPTSYNVPSPWPSNPAHNMNPYLVGMGTQPSMCTMNPMGMLGAMPICYAPSSTYQMPPGYETTPGPSHAHAYYHRHSNISTLNPNIPYQYHMLQPIHHTCSTSADASEVNHQTHNVPSNIYPHCLQNYLMPCTMIGEPYYRAPYNMSPPMDQQMSHTMQPNFSVMQLRQSAQPIELSSSNYDESTDERNKKKPQFYNTDSTNEKTDGESSYSSFYSSFFKTDSGSNEESDSKPRSRTSMRKKPRSSKLKSCDNISNYVPNEQVAKRKMVPPWLSQVPVTPELIYQYQIDNKNIAEVLSTDKEKLARLEQSPLVCEQLTQLYSDLQLQGANLTLAEGITSSSSSCEDTPSQPKPSTSKVQPQKREDIYEENAPFPRAEDSNSCSNKP